MKHISKFDGCVYDISHSVGVENGKEYDDCICLIWRDAPCGFDEAFDKDIPVQELVGWYHGDYEYDTTEYYIKDFYKKLLNKSECKVQKQLKTMDLPIAYVNFIGDCLDIIKEHDLYALLSAYDDCPEIAKQHHDEVIERLLKPLYEYDEDMKIILED